ncbi:Nn.00g006510.m01.CDS01 [Neocucurbitaria sp. VM-36]
MADAPEVSHANHYLQVDRRHEQPELENHYVDTMSPSHEVDPAKEGAYASHLNGERHPATILGLRRRNFWIMVGIAVLVVIAAVGGALAARYAGDVASS